LADLALPSSDGAAILFRPDGIQKNGFQTGRFLFLPGIRGHHLKRRD
jgi:hypothetical protein